MSSPAVTIGESADLKAAASLMREHDISSLLTVDDRGRPTGIVTERDLMHQLAQRGGAAAQVSVADVLQKPVHTIGSAHMLYLAIARMERLGIRHLAVVDELDGRLIGVISARALLRQRASQALIIGDQIDIAATGTELLAVHRQLLKLARSLLAEGVLAVQIAGVIAGITRDIHTRVASLVEAAMVQEGRGTAPAPWCFLVLGSAGRGESLLAADQDNALIHGSPQDDEPWFAEFAARLADMLNEAGIPYCKGDVMARHPLWRHNLANWERRIERWAANPHGENLLAVDIFLDFRPVAGDFALAVALRAATKRATSSILFLNALADELMHQSKALGLFNRFRSENGRVNVKRDGLLTLVSGARVLALKNQIADLATGDRLAGAVEAGALEPQDGLLFREAQELFLSVILEQQLLDMERGLEPGTKVEIRRLNPVIRERLRAALKEIDLMDFAVRDSLTK
jgi:signal-transduction protein with cAMP-binding, CBS, and nucleotidyltransferase domain